MTGRAAWMTDPLRDLLVQCRSDRELSLAQAADVVGVSKESLGAYERGDRIPPVPTLRNILGRYGIALAAVPDGSPAPPIPPSVPVELRRLAALLDGQVAA